MEINNSLRKFAEDIKKKLQNEEKFFVSALATRLTKVASENPKDVTIVQMANFLSAKSENPKNIFISREELTDAYKALWTTNTKCASFLKEELDESAVPELESATYADNSYDDVEFFEEEDYDHDLADALEASFSNKEVVAYSKSIAKRAELICSKVLPGKPTSIKAVDGRDFAIICQASYLTHKGTANVLIPVEVVGKQPLIPSVFLSQTGITSLSESNLEKHLKSVAGKSFRVDSGAFLEQIKVAKFGSTTDGLDEVDMAVLSLRAKTASTKVTYDGIKYEEIFAKQEQKEITQPVNQKYLKAYSDELSMVPGMAESVFGKNVVDLGKGIIAKELTASNVSSAQIKVSNFTEDKITYSVVANGRGFKVPVSVVKTASGDYSVTSPTVIITNSGIESFDKDGVKIAMDQNDYSIASDVIGLNTSSPSELIDQVKKACEIKDYDTARVALAKIQEIGDSGYYKHAFEIFNDSLFVKEASVQTHKMKTVMIGGNLVEATTGLPVDRVYVDESGTVRANYNKYAEVSEEKQQVTMFTNKIWGAMS